MGEEPKAAENREARTARMQSALRVVLQQRGLRNTRQREVIAEIFFSSDEHLSLDELLAQCRAQDSGIGYATVYRTLKLLTEVGLAHERHFEGATRYEAADDEHHDHLICTRCRAIVEFEEDEIERLQEEIATKHGYLLTDHRMELYGVCPECQRDDAATVPN